MISIIVPVYKVEKYLSRCVESILKQTYTDIEIFLVDDGSPDNCGKICEMFANRDPRVKVIHKENGGLSDARNAALEIFSGDYVTFIDSDDYVAEDYVERLYKLIETSGSQMSVICPNLFYEGKEPIQDVFETRKTRIFDCNTALSQMFYQKTFDNTAWAKMYHKSLFEKIRYPKGLLFEDLPTTYRLMLKCKTIAFNEYKGYFYFLRSDSIEGSAFNLAKYESCKKIVEQVASDSNTFSENVKRAANCRMVSFLFHVLLMVPTDQKCIRNDLLNKIKCFRKGVFFNKYARKKTRLAALLSYGGLFFIDIFAKYGLSRKK